MPLNARLFTTGLLASACLGFAALSAWAQAPDPAAEGQSVFTTAGCADCHGVNGEGGVGPNLAGNQFLSDANSVVLQVIGGGGEMPAFGDSLNDQQIAAVATYVRNSWGNTFGPVTPEEVATARAGGGGAGAAPAAPAAPAP
jgi:mono/diheme cytochrome c family protein